VLSEANDYALFPGLFEGYQVSNAPDGMRFPAKVIERARTYHGLGTDGWRKFVNSIVAGTRKLGLTAVRAYESVREIKNAIVFVIAG